MCILCRQSATTCEHHSAWEEQLHWQDTILRRSKVTLVLCEVLPADEGDTVAERWKPDGRIVKRSIERGPK